MDPHLTELSNIKQTPEGNDVLIDPLLAENISTNEAKRYFSKAYVDTPA